MQNVITKMKEILASAAVAVSAIAMTASPAISQEGANIFVVGGMAADPFWSIVKKGVEDAGLLVEAQGGSVTWLGPQNYENLGADAADLLRTALSQNPDAIIGADWVPEAMDDAFKAVVAAGVPLIIYNSGGIEKAEELGAMNYIGSDEYAAGVAGGEYFAKAGITNVLCVNHVPGAANLEARCQGILDGMAAHGGTASQLPLPASNAGNATANTQSVRAALVQDQSIDGVVTLGAAIASSAALAIEQAGAGERVMLGTFDMDDATLQRIKNGEQLFAIDQQPYLQGFLAVALLNGYVNYGLDVPTAPILTGPGIIDAKNIDATLAGVAAGAR